MSGYNYCTENNEMDYGIVHSCALCQSEFNEYDVYDGCCHTCENCEIELKRNTYICCNEKYREDHIKRCFNFDFKTDYLN